MEAPFFEDLCYGAFPCCDSACNPHDGTVISIEAFRTILYIFGFKLFHDFFTLTQSSSSSSWGVSTSFFPCDLTKPSTFWKRLMNFLLASRRHSSGFRP